MTFTDAEIETAVELIEAAENDLGRLSRSQRIDLLADNMAGSVAHLAALVSEVSVRGLI